LVRWFVGSLVRWFVGSLVRWFGKAIGCRRPFRGKAAPQFNQVAEPTKTPKNQRTKKPSQRMR
jgi:hypothetical protein